MASRRALAGAALIGAAMASPFQANGTAVITPGILYTTEVVTALTTYCPAPTTLTHNDKTYTVTAPTTLTITDCPCTISKPVEPTLASTTTPSVRYTTEVVTALTTYCPGPTAVTHGGKTYSVTEATTLTITDCPCTISKPVAEPTTTPKPSNDECAAQCYVAYNECRGSKGANFAFCAAKYAECLGYSPFGDDGSLVTPTACSKSAAAVSTGPASKPVVYTTEVVTALTTYCPAATTLTFNNATYTVTEPTTLTVTDCPCTISKPSAVPSQPAKDCPQECSDAYNMCRGATGANMASCAAKYAECLGYSPYGEDGSLITPTACSKSTAVTPTPVVVKPTTSAPPAKPTTTSVAVPVKPTTTSVAVPVKPSTTVVTIIEKPSTTSMIQKPSSAKPVVSENETTSKPAAKPTTSVVPAESVPATSAPAVPTDFVPMDTSVPSAPAPQPTTEVQSCAEDCLSQYDACGTGNEGEMVCAAELSQCLGFSPFDEQGKLVTPSACTSGATGLPQEPTAVATPTVVPTGAAGRLAPEHLLLALGAFALL